METTNVIEAPVHYNPNQLVTYKVIDLDATDQTISWPTVKVVDLEWELEQGRRKSKRLDEYSSKVTQVENRLADYLEMDSEDIVSELCNIFGFNPTKEVEFEANVTITGTVTVPLTELADFDIDNVELNIDANSYSHDVEIYNTEIDSITTL